jgi:hypothetical protein
MGSETPLPVPSADIRRLYRSEHSKRGVAQTNAVQFMEARGGIEPPMRVLQTLALPLGHRAPCYSIWLFSFGRHSASLQRSE